MAKTTTVRVDAATHSALASVARLEEMTVMDVVRESVAALHRERFAHRVAEQFADMRSDAKAWERYRRELNAGGLGDASS